jgi:hypothetical protein
VALLAAYAGATSVLRDMSQTRAGLFSDEHLLTHLDLVKAAKAMGKETPVE